MSGTGSMISNFDSDRKNIEMCCKAVSENEEENSEINANIADMHSKAGLK